MEDRFQVTPVSDRIFRIEMPGNVFGYLVKGDERCALIDTGFGVGSLRPFAEEMMGGLPYDVILTHGHLDHAGGAAEFDSVWLNEQDWALAAEHTQYSVRLASLNGPGRPELREADLIAPKTEGYLPLQEDQAFDLGGETLRIVGLGGHTKGSVGILFENERILLAGDACCSFTLFFGDGVSLKIREYRDVLAKLWETYGDRFDTVLYSHPHNYGGPEIIGQMITVCDEILDGKDDRIPMPPEYGREAFIAKAEGSDMRRIDGGIANLKYCKENL